MNIYENILKKFRAKNYSKELMLYVIERLKPWIVFSCLEKENYIITDKQAENLCLIIINQAVSLNAFDKVLKKVGL